jgi:hypothetical protein
MKRSLVALLATLGLLSNVAPAVAITHYQQVEICSAQATAGCATFDASGNLKVAGTFSSTTTFPYNGTNGQTITTSSFLGVGGLDGGGHFSPLKQDASQNLDINCITGCGGGSTTFPYAGTNGQALTAASFLGAGARDANGQFSPLQEDASQNLLAKIVTGSTTAVTQPTGTNLHAVLDTTSTTAVTQATGTNLHAVLDTTSTTAVTQATGTNLHAVLDTTSTTAVTQATASNLNAAVVGTGVAGTPAGGVLSIQGVTSGTPIISNSTLQTSANTIGNVNQTTGTAGYGFILDSAGTNVAGVDSSHDQLVSVNAWPLASSTLLGKVTAVLPYNGSGTGQTTTTNSAVGLVGFNGTTSDPIKSSAGAINAAVQGSNGAISSSASGTLATATCQTTAATSCANVQAFSADGQSLGAVNNVGVTASEALYNGSTWDRMRKDTYAAGPAWVTTGGGSTSFAITAGLAGPTVIKASAGRLVSFLITTAGTTGTETFYDNASACSGNVIGIANGTTSQATAIAGFQQALNYTATAGITACGGTGSPALTVGYF